MTSHQDGPANARGLVARPVAPQVARRVSGLVGEDRAALAETLGLLTHEQLAGTAAAPDPLPVTPAVRAAVTAGIPALDDEDRRVLLAAAVLVVDRVDVLLGATDVAVDRLLAPPLAQCLELADGRFRVVDPRLRAVVHEDADLTVRTTTHAALAAELERAGERDAARWHEALSTLAGDPGLADGLVALAERHLDRGCAVVAHEIAREAASHGTGEVRARAFLVAGRAALLAGHLHDAAEWLDRVVSTEVVSVQDDAARARDAVHALDARAAGGADGGQGVDGQGVDGQGVDGQGVDGQGVDGQGMAGDDVTGPPGVRLARLVEPVARAVVSPADRATLVAVLEALARIDRRPRHADAMLARAVVTAVPAGERAPWTSAVDGLSPLAEAHLRVVQALVLLRGGDAEQAVRVLADAAGRLPVAPVAGGLAAAVARCCGGSADGLAVALGSLGTAPDPAAVAACRRPGRGRRAARPSLVVSAAQACRDDGAGGSGPGAPGGDVWDRWAGVLTARELDVARLVAQGMANKQVADRLFVSVRTVEVHLGRVFRKVGVSSRAELTVRALRRAS